MMDTRRLILLVVFAFSIVTLWEAWQKENRPPPAAAAPAVPGAIPSAPAATGSVPAGTVPAGTAASAPSTATGGVPGGADTGAAGRTRIRVTTDLVSAEIDPQGGDIVRLEFLLHKDTEDPKKNFVLLSPEYRYSAQSGLTGSGLPNHRSLYTAESSEFKLADGADAVSVRLEATGTPEGVKSAKILTFKRGVYIIDVAHELVNGSAAPIQTSAYFHVTRDGRAPPGDTYMLQTFTGPAFYDDVQKYQKLSWSDLDKNKTNLPKDQLPIGWIAIVQHYFVSAWLPTEGKRELYAEKVSDQFYRAGVKIPIAAVAPGATARVSVPFYSGPQEQEKLAVLAPGLDLVVDYGFLTIIASPLFAVLKFFYALVNNWGWAIVLLTVMIKLIFFPLSAASYKSMAKMKLVTPRLTKLREQYGDDRMKMNQAMMELYKTEKINPLGGCLPIVVQIPVFISLYWVLLGSVELRQAPFMGWIKDLSAPDPWFVLPALMMGSMVIQTKMNPTPPDPVQAKVMMIMPFAFGIMFFWFPAGLVLYWFVNNLLSIAQQWQITRMMESAAQDGKGGKSNKGSKGA